MRGVEERRNDVGVYRDWVLVGYLEDGGGLGTVNLMSGRYGLGKELLSLESSDTAGAGAGDGLAVALVLDVTASEDTLDAGVAGAGLGDNVAILIELDLALDQRVGGVVANGVEETISLDDLLLGVDGALHAEVGHEAVRLAFTDDFGGNGVEADSALGVVEQTVSHHLGSTELVTANQYGNVAAVLGEEHGLLGGGVTTTDDVQGLVAEDWHSTVADGAGTDTILPVLLFTG